MTCLQPGFRLTHLITGLNTGGAETMLLKLCKVWASQGVRLEVIAMVSGGALTQQFCKLGIPVIELDMRRGGLDPLAVWRLMTYLRAHRPEVLQTWMYHADFLGGLVARLMGHPFPVVWNIRNSDLGPTFTKRCTRLVVQACAHMSVQWADRVFCCSMRAGEQHKALGYASDRLQVIPNGFELGRFHPDSGTVIRRELGIGQEVRILGQVARVHPMKGHAQLLKAMTFLDQTTHLLLCGDGAEATNMSLLEEIRKLGLLARVHLLGRRQDVSRIMAGLDFLVSPSIGGEGFPNVVGEAMVCETPCIVTDVGDSAFVVGDYGWVVPPGDADALAHTLGIALALPDTQRREMGARCRSRIVDHFDIYRVADRYLSEYATLL